MKKLLIILFCYVALLACQTSHEIKDGSLAFKLKKYELSKSLLNKEIATSKDKEKIIKMIELAESYQYTSDAENALKWYKNAQQSGAGDTILFKIAMMQKQIEDYPAAIQTLEQYKKSSAQNLRVISEIAICKKAIALRKQVHNMTIENLSLINSSGSDFSVIPYKENQLVISSTRNKAKGKNIHPWNGQKNSDLFLVDRKNNSVSSLDSILNTDASEGNISFNQDYSEAYFTRCGFSTDVDQNGYCHIYRTKKEGDFWLPAEKLTLFDDTINVGQAFLAPNGKKLYFSSDAPFGYGGRDIYFAHIRDDEVGVPINLGYTINTKEDELFPTLDSKQDLYFSSNGRAGFGGLDIFKAKALKKGFDVAQQLPYPINTGADDFYFVYTKEFDGKEINGLIEEGFFVSNRKNGKGGDDIYAYKKELFNTFKLELYIVEKSFEDPQNDKSKFLGLIPLDSTKIDLKSPLTNKNIEAVTDKTGTAFFALDSEVDYEILVSKNGYFNQSATRSTKNYKDLNQIEITLRDTIELEKIYPEKEIVIDFIYYDLDKADLRLESLPILDKLVSFFEQNKDLVIEIGAHTDSRGSDDYNLNLSNERAQSVVNYLWSKGLPKSQLISKGYGELKLLNRCANDVECTEEEHQKNRRTSFKVISSNGILKSQ